MESLQNLCSKIIANYDQQYKDDDIPIDVKDLISHFKLKCWKCNTIGARKIIINGSYVVKTKRGYITILCKTCHDVNINGQSLTLSRCLKCFIYVGERNDKYWLADNNLTILCKKCVKLLIKMEHYSYPTYQLNNIENNFTYTKIEFKDLDN